MQHHKLVSVADDVAAILGAVGNGKRLAILCHLADGEMSVGAIASKVGLSQSALSQHLAKLRAMDLVQTRRERQLIYYSCKSKKLLELLRSLETIYVT
jgi:DNA-binding transcriptional ArsR family regulator